MNLPRISCRAKNCRTATMGEEGIRGHNQASGISPRVENEHQSPLHGLGAVNRPWDTPNPSTSPPLWPPNRTVWLLQARWLITCIPGADSLLRHSQKSPAA